MGYSDACAEADVTTGCDGMELGQDSTRIRSQRGKDFTVTAEKQGKRSFAEETSPPSATQILEELQSQHERQAATWVTWP